MKYFASIGCLCIALLMGGCASTSGSGNVNSSWDKAFNEESRTINIDILYEGYNPDYDNYHEVSLREANNTVRSNSGNRSSFDGYFYSKDLVVIHTADNMITVCYPDDLQKLNDDRFRRYLADRNTNQSIYFYLYTTRNLSSRLKQLSIITVWYRGIWRYKEYQYKAGYNAGGLFLDKFEITGQFVKEPTAADIAEAERQAERQQPRFSPEGQEYVKRTLTQAVGEANKPANRGKTLFFESDVNMKQGVITGQWRVSELISSGITIMEYYERPPFWDIATILYRVEISNTGFARYVIDSLRQ